MNNSEGRRCCTENSLRLIYLISMVLNFTQKFISRDCEKPFFDDVGARRLIIKKSQNLKLRWLHYGLEMMKNLKIWNISSEFIELIWFSMEAVQWNGSMEWFISKVQNSKRLKFYRPQFYIGGSNFSSCRLFHHVMLCHVRPPQIDWVNFSSTTTCRFMCLIFNTITLTLSSKWPEAINSSLVCYRSCIMSVIYFVVTKQTM